MGNLTVGTHLLVAVHPDHGGGSDTAPAWVTRLNDDGTVNVRALPDSDKVLRLENLAVHADRAALDAALDEHRAMLPPSRERDGNDNVIAHSPHHVYQWATGAYWPEDSQPVSDQAGEDADPVDDPEQVAAEPRKTAPKKTAGASAKG